jgi:hypothetical protein
VFHYTGNLIITTRAGTLTIHDRGILDMGKGAYFELQNVVAGTGAFAGAKGMLTSQGQFSGASFSGSITGKVCRPSRHHDHPGRHHDGDDEDDSAGAEDSATE